MFKHFIPTCDVNLQIGDIVYKLFYDDVTFHIEKTKIINIEEQTHKVHGLPFKETYFICENGFEFELGEVDKDINRYNEYHVFSSLDKLKECVRKEIRESIYSMRMLIEKYQQKLNILENRKKLYEVN